jgi:hypothetical protein
MQNVLAHEDFSDLDIGPFPSDYFATGEYHYLPPSGRTGRWYQPTRLHSWRPNVAWVVFQDGNRRRMLQTLLPDKRILRMLTTGSDGWTDYVLTVRLQPLRADGFVGVLFRCQTSRTTYRAGFDGPGLFRLVRDDHEEHAVLAEAAVEYSCDQTYCIQVKVAGPDIQVLLDDRPLLAARDAAFACGKVGIAASTTAIFDSLEVMAEDSVCAANVITRDRRLRELDDLRQSYPKPALVRRLDTKGFGAARNLRFGHLRNRDHLDLVLAQTVPFLPGDANSWGLRALTAMDLDGNVLWQFGTPAAGLDAAMTMCDMPVQVYDIDGDGQDEVLCMRNFNFYILDGRDGSVKSSFPLPRDPAEENRFGQLLGDAIIIANFRGLARPADIVIKNRYKQFWAYDEHGRRLWDRRSRQTGHFAVPFDFDGTGKDDLLIGYSRVGPAGELRWELPWGDHADEIAVGSFDPNRPGVQIALACGDEGSNILAPDGTVLHREMLGHAQRLTAAKFRDDLEGVQFYVVTYWGHAGIISLHDCTGRRLLQFQPNATGNVLSPVNWTGKGTELALLSGSVEHGGMIDGHGRTVVVFPDDGHPQLCAEAIDLLGDGRDEILLWDQDAIWIYTQDAPHRGELYRPLRCPLWNRSNYRAEVSLPPR